MCESEILLSGKVISLNAPTYFIADIAANHDGDLNKAKELIGLAKESGADAVKFQHFLAEKIVSDFGFKSLGGQLSHQASWGKSVFDVYKQYELKREWNLELIEYASKCQIAFMTTPYDLDAVNELDSFLNCYKIGSGDITWIDFLVSVAERGKPILLACGASNMLDVDRAVSAILNVNKKIVLMQCNTNYTASLENFKYINLNVLKTFAAMYPDMVLGLSDHTPGHATVLGAVTLGARVIEKHFTDDNNRAGPDHLFSMNPISWREMVDRTRELELALGNGKKIVEENERQTVVVQRRCVRLSRSVVAGTKLSHDDLSILRPAPAESIPPYDAELLIGKEVISDLPKGYALTLRDIR